ncbi:MAG: hypothetical protein GY722_07710 [bacterium]|nr:hypothetical protein [bacterium]
MIKKISFFQLLSGESWPSSFSQFFPGNFSRNIPSFEAGSELEAEFQMKLKDSGLNVLRQEILKVTGKDLSRFPFHYLCLREDSYYGKPEIKDKSSACSGCGVGATQIEKVQVDSKKSKKLDIMNVPWGSRPFVYLVSRRLRDLFADQAFTGFRLVPCLRFGADYSRQERKIDFSSDRQEEDATHFQLIVIGRTRGTPQVGQVYRVFSECSECGVIKGCFFESFARFKPGDLDEKDFQLAWHYDSANRGRFGIGGELCIISERVFRFFKANKISGLQPYLDSPRIPHGVVDIGT